MKTKLWRLFFLMTFMDFTVAYSQDTPATDYLKLAGPILFEQQSYHLVWTSHPATNFYKQEYIEKNDVISKFKTMILVDFITGNNNIKEIVGAKIAELKRMKEANPMVNYEILENPKNGEYILDFLLSQNTPDGRSLSIVERNVYRYKMVTDKSGKRGLLLFGVSTRSYDNDIDKFLISLKSNRNQLIKSVSQFNIPEISLAK